MEVNKINKVLALISGLIHSFFGVLLLILSLIMNINREVFMTELYKNYTEQELQAILGVTDDPAKFILMTLVSIGLFFIVIAVLTLYGFFSINKNYKKAGILLIIGGVVALMGSFVSTGFMGIVGASIFNIYPGVVYYRAGKNQQTV